MEPLSALNLAGNILQFVQFAFGLLNSTQNIYRSASGASEENQHLDDIYAKLYNFCNQLNNEASNGTNSGNDAAASKYASDLTETAKTCQKDCKILLEIVEKLRVKDNSKKRWWRCFSKAMQEVWLSDDIARLKARIDDSRASLILRLCAISTETINRSASELAQVRSEMRTTLYDRMQQSTTLNDSLQDLRSEIQYIKTEVVRPDGYGIRRSLKHEEVNTLIAQVAELSLTERKFAKEDAVISSLDFDQRPIRYEAIPQAHRATFRWIFKNPTTMEDTFDTRFVDWLESDNELFWISGKPGSGKSTLMKYIVNAAKTKSLLSKWAQPKRVVLASYYFWSAGSPIQRTRHGLLRSLLYDVLTQVPELIPSVCSLRWQGDDIANIRSQRWQEPELEASLHSLTSVAALPVKFCFFIDGLDEYEGDSLNISSMLQDLSRSSDVKLCVSSRPWNVFEDLFGYDRARKFYVHDLTRLDIQRYAEDRMHEHPRWRAFSAQKAALALINEITNRASGVFLWVFLVTRTLREGLTNDDSLTDLWKRLDSLPTDLDQFFRHILLSVEPFYLEKMAGALLMALAARQPLPVEVYTFHELEYEDKDYVLKRPTRVMDEDEIEAFYKSTARRLNGWCKGLIESRANEVEFIHRTVRDFLQTGDIIKVLKERAMDAFCPGLSIMRSYIAWIKSTQFDDENTWSRIDSLSRSSFRGKVQKVLTWARYIQDEDLHSRDSCETLLNDLELSILNMLQSGQLRLAELETLTSISTYKSVRSWFQEQLIEHDLGDFISRKLSCDPKYLTDCEQAPLSIALDGYVENMLIYIDDLPEFTINRPGCLDVLRCLLENGESFNELVILDPEKNATSTPWIDFLSMVLRSQFEFRTTEAKTKLIIETLETGLFAFALQHGANPNVDLPSQYPCFSSYYCSHPFWMAWLLLAFEQIDLWKYSEYYLRDLRVIFRYADFSTMLQGAAANNDPAYNAPWSIFCLHLESVDTEHEERPLNEKGKDLLVQVILEFAKFAEKSKLPWDATMPTLLRIFSTAQLHRLRPVIGKNSEPTTTVKLRRGAKRIMDSTANDSQAKKRRLSLPKSSG
ncbi:MAG: hypothetical protein Q9190_007688 [Brigantiaea leucoxantha]